MQGLSVLTFMNSEFRGYKSGLEEGRVSFSFLASNWNLVPPPMEESLVQSLLTSSYAIPLLSIQKESGTQHMLSGMAVGYQTAYET